MKTAITEDADAKSDQFSSSSSSKSFVITKVTLKRKKKTIIKEIVILLIMCATLTPPLCIYNSIGNLFFLSYQIKDININCIFR